MMPAFPKIYAVGSPEIKGSLFSGPVEVTEKIDGSQLGFGRDSEGRLMIRSKGAPIFQNESYVRQPDKLFKAACDYIVNEAQHKINPGEYWYGEVISAPKHNTLTYGRVPRNHVLVYGVMANGNSICDDHSVLTLASDRLGFDTVPILFEGTVQDVKQLDEWLKLDSVLGGCKIEGVVIKNYNAVADSKFSPHCFGKYVSEAFKEANGAGWAEQKRANSVDAFIESFKNDEARWVKAIQHRQEDGLYTGTLKDIGPLIDDIIKDMLEENAKAIKEKLFKLYERQFRGAAVAGFPEFYKKRLAEQCLILTNNETKNTNENIKEPTQPQTETAIAE